MNHRDREVSEETDPRAGVDRRGFVRALGTGAAAATVTSAGVVTPGTLFRGFTRGDLIGPSMSQFLLKDIPFGALRIPQRMRTVVAGLRSIRPTSRRASSF